MRVRSTSLLSRIRPGPVVKLMGRVLVETVLPASCPVCSGTLGEHRGGVCRECWDEVARTAFRHDGRVGFSGRYLASLTTLGPYEGRLRKIVTCLKFAEMPALGVPLGTMLAARLHSLRGDFDMVVPVPLHWRRRWGRGYNQSEAIAGPLARETGRPLVTGALRRRLATAPQTARTRRARVVNVKGAFVVRSRRGEVAGASILLVDDVATTGATIRECARVLKVAGADTVHAATASRTFSQG